METRQVGRTGIEVSTFCFGTWQLGGLAWGPVKAEDGVALLQRALDRGITVYDCSDNYGNGRSEVLLSVAFHRKRQQVVYITKLGYLSGLDGARAVRTPHGIGGHDQDYSPEYIRWACELSLRRLNTDYIDLYLLHDPPKQVLLDRAPFEALRDLQKAGKIRAYGVSTTADDAVLAIRKQAVQVVMVPFSLADQEAAGVLLPLAAERGVGVFARSPFGNGLLHDGILEALGAGERPAFSPFEWRSQASQGQLAMIARRASQLRFLIDMAGGSLTVAALRFVLSHPQIASVATGIMGPEELETDIAACRPPYYEPAALARARTLSKMTIAENAERWLGLARQRVGKVVKRA